MRTTPCAAASRSSGFSISSRRPPRELLAFVDGQERFGLGIGYVDAQLLAATRLTPGASLWTRDRRPHAAASSLGAGWSEGP